MSNERRVIVRPDKVALAHTVATRFIKKTIELIDDFDEATVSLTGGSMGIAVLAAIRASQAQQSIDWSRVNVWWSDERWLPSGDPERNETQAREALLDHVALDTSRVHPFAASDSGLELDAAAEAYAAELAHHAADSSPQPNFDISMLGMGPDGHIASLFPERSGVRETHRTVIPVANSPKPPLERLSLTLPVINSSARVWLVVAGADKASALGLSLAGASMNEVPAAGVLGRRKTLFFVDADAAAEVPESLIDPGKFWTGSHDKS